MTSLKGDLAAWENKTSLGKYNNDLTRYLSKPVIEFVRNDNSRF